MSRPYHAQFAAAVLNSRSPTFFSLHLHLPRHQASSGSCSSGRCTAARLTRCRPASTRSLTARAPACTPRCERRSALHAGVVFLVRFDPPQAAQHAADMPCHRNLVATLTPPPRSSAAALGTSAQRTKYQGPRRKQSGTGSAARPPHWTSMQRQRATTATCPFSTTSPRTLVKIMRACAPSRPRTTLKRFLQQNGRRGGGGRQGRRRRRRHGRINERRHGGGPGRALTMLFGWRAGCCLARELVLQQSCTVCAGS